jgi:hypothetical protein
MRTLIKQYVVTFAWFLVLGSFVMTVYGGFFESKWAVDPIRNPLLIALIAGLGFFVYFPYLSFYLAPPLAVSALIFVLLCNTTPALAKSWWARAGFGAISGVVAAFVVESVTFRWGFDVWLTHNAVAYALPGTICGAVASMWPRFRPSNGAVADPAADGATSPTTLAVDSRRTPLIAGLHVIVTLATCVALITQNLRTEEDVFFEYAAENAATRFRAESSARKAELVSALLGQPNSKAELSERPLPDARMLRRTLVSKGQVTSELESLYKLIQEPRYSTRSISELAVGGTHRIVQYSENYAVGEVYEMFRYRLKGRQVALSSYVLSIAAGSRPNQTYVSIFVEEGN